MIRYLVDSSAVWRILREPGVAAAWSPTIMAGGLGSCHPQRAEFRRSARSLAEFEAMGELFSEQYPDAPVPKAAWRWIDSSQYRLARGGVQRALSVADLLICATAAQHGLFVLHDDADFRTAARHLSDVRERSVRSFPGK